MKINSIQADHLLQQGPRFARLTARQLGACALLALAAAAPSGFAWAAGSSSVAPATNTTATTPAITAWRCGDGGRSYGDQPCAGGRAVQLADTRSAQQAAAGREDTARMQALASRMRRERLEDENRALAANRRAANLGPATVTADATKVAATKKPTKTPKSGKQAAKKSDSTAEPKSRRAYAAP